MNYLLCVYSQMYAPQTFEHVYIVCILVVYIVLCYVMTSNLAQGFASVEQSPTAMHIVNIQIWRHRNTVCEQQNKPLEHAIKYTVSTQKKKIEFVL